MIGGLLTQLRVFLWPLLIAVLAAVGLPAAFRYVRLNGVCRRCGERLAGRGLVVCPWCGRRALILRLR
jgi:tRNA(Ile2) C34 agmatinyltransferase TiaS